MTIMIGNNFETPVGYWFLLKNMLIIFQTNLYQTRVL